MPPAAVLNPQTKRPVGKKRVYDVFRKLCYDEDPVKPWKHQKRLTASEPPAKHKVPPSTGRI